MNSTLRLHQCAQCKTERKLPYPGDLVQSYCDQCKAMTLHQLRAEHTLAESIESRMSRFLDRMSVRTHPENRSESPPSDADVVAKLRSGGYPSRQIEGINSMRGPGREMAENLRKFRRKDSHYALFGPNGTGKTQIAAKVAALRFINGQPAGRYVTCPDLLSAMKSGIDRNVPVDELLRPYRTSGFLVVDEAQDMGSTDKSTQWMLDALRTIADVRYREFRPMLWLLNAASPKDVADRLGARIIDRVNETGGLIHCNWPSYRAA